MGCPSCGNAVETTSMGTCTSCDTPITKGQLQWQATLVKLDKVEPSKPPEVGLLAGGDEPSYHEPSITASN